MICSYLQYLYLLTDISSSSYYFISYKKRNILRQEMERLFNGRAERQDIERMAKDSFRLYLKRQAENLIFGRLDNNCFNQITFMEGLDNIEKAVAKGHGVILLLSHFGSFLLPLPVLGFRGYSVNQITGRVLSRNIITKIIWKLRKREADRLPIKFIGVANFLRPVYDALKRDEIVAIAFDGREGKKWIPTPFLNRTALFSPGPFNLALKTGAAIIPAFVIRQPDNRHRIIFMEEFDLTKVDDLEETLAINTKRYAEILEGYVIKYPCHFGATLLDIRLNADRGIASPLFQDN